MGRKGWTHSVAHGSSLPMQTYTILLTALTLSACVVNNMDDDDNGVTTLSTVGTGGSEEDTGDTDTTGMSLDDTGTEGETSTDSGGTDSTSGGGGLVCDLDPQDTPYAPCESECYDACQGGMHCVVDAIENPQFALCSEVCTVTANGIEGCSPTMWAAPFDVPTCQHFQCVVPCAMGACPDGYECVFVAGASLVDICMPLSLVD